MQTAYTIIHTIDWGGKKNRILKKIQKEALLQGMKRTQTFNWKQKTRKVY